MRNVIDVQWAMQAGEGGRGAGDLPALSRTANALVACVRAHARLRATWVERLWSEGQTSFEQGLAITPAEVQRILIDPAVEISQYEHFLQEDITQQHARAAAAANAALAVDPFWDWITVTFGLNVDERNLLCLLVAVELEPKLGRVLAYLADDTQAVHPTLEAAASLFASDGPAGRIPACVAPPALLRWRLAQPLDRAPAWQSRTAWRADAAVLASVLAQQWMEAAPLHAVRLIEPASVQQLPCVYPDVLAAMLDALRSSPVSGPPDPRPGSIDAAACEIALIGPAGSGRQTLAAQFGAALGRPMLAVDVAMLVDFAQARAGSALDTLVPAVRLAHAHGAILHVRDAEGLATADWLALRELAGLSVRGTRRMPASATCGFVLAPLSTTSRASVWSHYSAAPPAAIVRSQRLTPAQIRRAAQSAAQPQAAAHAADQAHQAQTTQTTQTSAFEDLLHLLPCPYGWDDLVVAPALRRALEDFEAQVRLRWEVYEGWGFQRLTHLGLGVSALFGGPSGTGKTMAAQVLARSLGLRLYRVDLAGVVNKYIGETEKRLRDVFEACEQPDVLLFFDEADALFGSRMQVKDAHDRFANIEIDYLLQRIEAFDGVSILATNRKNDLDSAFLRRLRFVMDFLPPGRVERLALWLKALPTCSPGGERIVDALDYEVLAGQLDLNGAQIKAIALSAAFLARGAGKRIGIEHIELAALRELSKAGLHSHTPLGGARPS